MTRKGSLDVTPSPRLLEILGEIPLEPWQCLAELIDNGLDELARGPVRSADRPLKVSIELEADGGETYLSVTDNGLGMDLEGLERSLRAGYTSKGRYGTLGLFGMGFNIATARLGTETVVRTKTPESSEWLLATISFADLQRQEDFQVPWRSEPGTKGESGTTVRIRLKKEAASLLTNKAHQRVIQATLGDVYSFVLRDAVPGLRDDLSARLAVQITFAGEALVPRLPCVWRDSRAVVYKGQEVRAIQYVDFPLTEATACLDCGYWDRKNGPERCEECGSANLEVKARRVWGWLGVQRYIDTSNFGVDFIRYGRKILVKDKGIFEYRDPDTLQIDKEYPVEMPQNFGRLVGEIHLDHVPVTYQKNDFDRNSRDWQTAMGFIRGEGPLKPQRSAGLTGVVNDSPLARLFNAYRRNDPGAKCLIPGDGDRAIHVKTREWGSFFDKGLERFREDTEWFDQVVFHDVEWERKRRQANPVDGQPGSDGGGLLPPPSPEPEGGGAEPLPGPLSDDFAQLRQLGVRRVDLSGQFTLPRDLGTWSLEVWVTRGELPEGRPASPGRIAGESIEVFVASGHPVFTEFGRDVRDVALMEAASLVRDLRSSKARVVEVFAALVENLRDLRVTPGSLLERVDRSLVSIRSAIANLGPDVLEKFWVSLEASEKETVERGAGVRFSDTPFAQVVEAGDYVELLSARGIALLVQDFPDDFFEGAVFRPSIRRRPEAIRAQTIARLTAALRDLQAYQTDPLLQQERYAIQSLQLQLSLLDELTVAD